MKLTKGFILLAISLLGACTTTTKRGEYEVRIREVATRRVEVSGLLNASAAVNWDKTLYGAEPKALVRLIIAGLLPDAPAENYDVGDIGFTRYEAGNYIGWSAVVTGSDKIIRELAAKMGRQFEGRFSLEEVRLIEGPNDEMPPKEKAVHH